MSNQIVNCWKLNKIFPGPLHLRCADYKTKLDPSGNNDAD